MLLTPFPEYLLCARSLNNYHLALNLRLAKSIYSGILYPKGFSSSPIVALWKDTPEQLLLYAACMANEAKNRLLPDEIDWSIFATDYKHKQDKDITPPFWLGNTGWHRYHRQLLHETDQLWYNSIYIKTGVGMNFDNGYKANPDQIFKDSMDTYVKERSTAFIVNKKSIKL